MSYYSYKKKIFVETSKGDIFPLTMYSDSSIRDDSGHMVWKWMIYGIKKGAILCPKEEFKKIAAEMLEDQKRLIKECAIRCREEEEVTKDSFLYSGNVYLGGRRLRDLQRFLSVRNTVPAEKFFRKNGWVGIYHKVYDNNWRVAESTDTMISNEEQLYKAQELTEELQKTYPEFTVCHSVYGLI